MFTSNARQGPTYDTVVTKLVMVVVTIIILDTISIVTSYVHIREQCTRPDNYTCTHKPLCVEYISELLGQAL